MPTVNNIGSALGAIAQRLDAAPSRGHSHRGNAKGAEIAFTQVSRIPPGEYLAFSRDAKVYWDKGFRRWVCAVQFDIVDGSLINVQARLTWYLNLGSGEKPRAGLRTNFWQAWVKANGGPPKRKDRMTGGVFERRHATVIVADTAKTHNSGTIDVEASYSVVRGVVEWRTGGRP